jgi:hypothetical protein
VQYLSIFRYNLNNLLYLDLQGRAFHCPLLQEQIMSGNFCIPTGDVYLRSRHISTDPGFHQVYKNLLILFGMTPAYLLVAFIVLRSLKKKV